MSATPSSTPVPQAPSSALLLKLQARPDFSQVEQMPRGAERKAAAWEALTQVAEQSQQPFVALAERLRNEGAITGYETLVSPNMLVVTPASGKKNAVLDAFKGVEGLKSVYDNSSGHQAWPAVTDSAPPIAPGEPAWGLDVQDKRREVAPPAQAPYGIDMVGAKKAWELGATGKGLVYGSIDTGVDATHEAIAARYRGLNADGTVTHDYNWFDMESRPSPTPVDRNGHGTHTIGTVTGERVGVAPEAKFISVNGLAGGVDSTLKALQWMQAPTKVDGSAPDPTKAPDVVGMSWWTGRNDQDLFLESMQNLRAAGIEPIKSAGNKGPGARTISSPGQFPELLAAAAIDKNRVVANFSSRGPAPYPKGSTTPKPDFSAPGVDVISSTPGNRYSSMSGTSMAQPHLSGVVLAVLSKYPQLTHDQLVQALQAGATDLGAPGADVEYGAGLVNIPAALDAAGRLLGAAAAKPTAAAA